MTDGQERVKQRLVDRFGLVELLDTVLTRDIQGIGN